MFTSRLIFRRRLGTLLVAVGTALVPTVAKAQSAIAGQVTDASGAVLPGVSVEAASPALIEGVRSAITDPQGRYTIEALRPGVYKVTFTLPGFSTLIREDIELQANFTAPINVQLRVGGVEESITVTGESPLIDVQRSTRREVLNREVLDVLPTGRNAWSIGATIPAMQTSKPDVGGLTGGQQAGLSIHGSRGQVFEVEGMNVNCSAGSGTSACLYHDDSAYQEMAYESVGGSAETQTSGVKVNMIPKEGGNTFSGTGVAIYSDHRFYSQNFTEELKARGLAVPGRMEQLRDYNTSLGGPLKQNKLWFFASARVWGMELTYPDTFSQPGIPTRGNWTYDNRMGSYILRLTTQLTQKNKLSAYYDRLPRIRPRVANNSGSYEPGFSPEATLQAINVVPYIAQVKWTSTVTSRLLLEAGYSTNHLSYGVYYQDDIEPGAVSKQDTVLSNRWNAGQGEQHNMFNFQHSVASASYVTGTHSVKAGVQYSWGATRVGHNMNQDLVQQYANGVPFQVLVRNTPIYGVWNKVDREVAFFAQDSWRLNRLTINPGIRFAFFKGSIPDQVSEAGRFVPARSFSAVDDLPTFSDWSPRLGVVYDLFGDAKTALKFTFGHYVEQQAAGFSGPYNPMSQQQDLRTWRDTNGDDIAQDNEIGPSRNAQFGLARGANTPDPDLQRAYDLLFNLTVQHELRPGISVGGGFYRRQFYDFPWTDNLETTHADYTPIGIPDPRGNGQTITVYNLNRNKLGLVNNSDTTSAENRRWYNGYDLSLNARFGAGGTLLTGIGAGATTNLTCEVNDPNGLRFCDQRDFDIPWKMQFKLAGSYPLPFWGLQTSAVVQSIPGAARQITYLVTRAQIPSLTLSSVTVPLSEPGSSYLDRYNQLDLRFSKVIRYRTATIRPQLDFYNLANSSAVLSQNNAFGPALDRVQTIIDGRVIRFGVQANF